MPAGKIRHGNTIATVLTRLGCTIWARNRSNWLQTLFHQITLCLNKNVHVGLCTDHVNCRVVGNRINCAWENQRHEQQHRYWLMSEAGRLGKSVMGDYQHTQGSFIRQRTQRWISDIGAWHNMQVGDGLVDVSCSWLSRVMWLYQIGYAGMYKTAVETQFSTGWYWPILRLMTTGLHSTTSPSCTQDTFPHLRLVRIVAHLCVLLHIFAFHCASLRFTAHLRVSPRIFVFHRDLVRIIAGASIHCPASSLVHRIPFITISDYVWHCTIIISLWTLILHHLHT